MPVLQSTNRVKLSKVRETTFGTSNGPCPDGASGMAMIKPNGHC